MRMGQGVRTGLGHGGITCVLQTQFSIFFFFAGGGGGGSWRQIAGEMTSSMQTRLRMLLYTAFANISVFRYK